MKIISGEDVEGQLLSIFICPAPPFDLFSLFSISLPYSQLGVTHRDPGIESPYLDNYCTCHRLSLRKPPRFAFAMAFTCPSSTNSYVRSTVVSFLLLLTNLSQVIVVVAQEEGKVCSNDAIFIDIKFDIDCVEVSIRCTIDNN